MYRQRKTTSTNNWPIVFLRVVQAIQLFVWSIVRLTFFGMLSHPTVDLKQWKFNLFGYCSNEKCEKFINIANEPFVRQPNLCPNIAAIRIRIRAFCGQESV